MNIVGLDPGVSTGYARWDVAAGTFIALQTIKIHQAMRAIEQDRPAVVLFEDARKRQWFAERDGNVEKYGAGVREGAGAAKRDAKIWEDFLEDIGQPYLARTPRRKLEALLFNATTGYQGKTSQHARDAGMLVYNHTAPLVQSLLTEYRGRAETKANPPAFQPRRSWRARARARA